MECKEYTLIIPGRLPGLNEYIAAERTNRFMAAKMKREAQNTIFRCIASCLRGVHIRKPVSIKYKWVEPNRRRDKSNISAYGRKVIEDALVETKVLRDDNWSCIRGFEDSFDCDPRAPHVEVRIIEEN